jgi:hypothetical protein
VASVGESPYRAHVADGFDAAVHYRYPFTHTAGTRWRGRLMARGLARGPKRYRYPDEPAGPPADLDGTVLPSVYPNWDNTPRLGRRGFVATGSTPERFAVHVRRALERAAANPPGERVVVVKSWNEWAEGNYLEPDLEVGTARLEALAAEVARARAGTDRSTR